jgi:hypothetical protein
MKFELKVIRRIFRTSVIFASPVKDAAERSYPQLIRNTPLLIFSSNFLLDEIVLH